MAEICDIFMLQKGVDYSLINYVEGRKLSTPVILENHFRTRGIHPSIASPSSLAVVQGKTRTSILGTSPTS